MSRPVSYHTKNEYKNILRKNEICQISVLGTVGKNVCGNASSGKTCLKETSLLCEQTTGQRKAFSTPFAPKGSLSTTELVIKGHTRAKSRNIRRGVLCSYGGLVVWPCFSGDCLRYALKIGFYPGSTRNQVANHPGSIKCTPSLHDIGLGQSDDDKFIGSWSLSICC